MLNNASSKDANHDGTIDYTLDLHQASQMTNDLDLGVNVGWSVDLLKAAGWWDFGLDSGDWSAGPVYHAGDTYDVASIDLYKTTFGFNFEDQMLHFAGNETLV